MRRKTLAWILGILAVLLLVTAAGAWTLFGTFIKAANSIRQLEDGLYAMEYHGDYGFEEFLESGGAANEEILADFLTSYLSRGFFKSGGKVEPGTFGCSTICMQDEDGDTLFGRNFDWGECRSIIVHTIPSAGYESVSTCCLDFLGFDESYSPDGSMMDRMLTLAAVYVPLDGMNEKGLIVADLMAGDKEETHQQTEKTDLTTTTAIRLLLDRAASVDEAIDLLRQYDMNSEIGAAHHLSIADASGRSVVVEYVDGKMLVTETTVVTNHYLNECAKKSVGSSQSHLRYETLSAAPDTGDEETVRALLESVAQKNYPQDDGSYERTMWSIVYALSAGYADFYFTEDYTHAYRLTLGEREAISS
ncbi:MAG: linear amide C-N hydrolase [Selenomonadaceae bacterium]|nr:linear amide C-N hydrolase [Selenomonadaceae bacterium]